MAYFALSAIIGAESHIIYQELAYGRDPSNVDYMAAATFGLKVGVGTGGIALSGGTSLGAMGTAGLFTSIAGFNVFTRLAHDKQPLMEMDWAGIYAQSGAMTGVGAIVGPWIGSALKSQNLLLNYGTRAALGSLGGYGSFEGGKHVYEGYAHNDWALAAYGGTEFAVSVFGTYQLMKSGVYPRLKQGAQLTGENVAGGASIKTNVSEGLAAEEGAEAAESSALLRGKDTPYNPRVIRAYLEGKYGAQNISSTTVPSASVRNLKALNTKASSGIVYDYRGLPIFDDVSVVDLRIANNFASIKNRGLHLREATRQLRNLIDSGAISRSKFSQAQVRAIQGGQAKIPGLTWHHHQDFGRLQLVPFEIHQSAQTPHFGGFELWFGR